MLESISEFNQKFEKLFLDYEKSIEEAFSISLIKPAVNASLNKYFFTELIAKIEARKHEVLHEKEVVFKKLDIFVFSPTMKKKFLKFFSSQHILLQNVYEDLTGFSPTTYSRKNVLLSPMDFSLHNKVADKELARVLPKNITFNSVSSEFNEVFKEAENRVLFVIDYFDPEKKEELEYYFGYWFPWEPPKTWCQPEDYNVSYFDISEKIIISASQEINCDLKASLYLQGYRYIPSKGWYTAEYVKEHNLKEYVSKIYHFTKDGLPLENVLSDSDI